MSQGSAPVSNPFSVRGAGTELWLFRPGPHAELEERRRDFAGTLFTRVLCAPGADERTWAAAFAEGSGGPSTPHAELGPPRPGETRAELAERAWAVLEAALGIGEARLLVVLPTEVLGVLVARALGFPLARAEVLRVDPGHAVLLRDDPLGIVLRRSNVRAPEHAPGTPLPSGRPEAR